MLRRGSLSVGSSSLLAPGILKDTQDETRTGHYETGRKGGNTQGAKELQELRAGAGTEREKTESRRSRALTADPEAEGKENQTWCRLRRSIQEAHSGSHGKNRKKKGKKIAKEIRENFPGPMARVSMLNSHQSPGP